MKSSSSHQKGPSAPGPEEARSGFENEFQVTLEECIKENSYQKLRNLYAKLMTKERHSSLNMSNLQDNVIPTLQAKVASLKEELEPLRVSKEKGDSSIQRLKTLSQELTRKLESVVQDSKRAQMEEKKIRESQTNSFSEKVKEISARLQALEVNKERMIQENNELRADLAKCIALASEDSSAEALDDHSSFGLEDEEDDLNVEHEPMIFEDYRSHSVRLSEVDSDLQDELSQFVGRFQELSTSLTKNNTELIEHRSRVHELDQALAKLEATQKQGKQEVDDLTQEFYKETEACEAVQAREKALETRLAKYKQVNSALQNTVDNLKQEISQFRPA